MILAKAGLKQNYVCLEPDLYFWDKSAYTHYTTEQYRKSAFYEADSAYGMYEGHLVHHDTGLRVSFLGTESYFGGSMSYKLTSAYVLTEGRHPVYIDDIDNDNRIFIAGDIRIPFDQTLKD